MKTKLKKIWSDKKRILGMPITFTTYSLSEDRLFIDKGLIKLESEEILLYRIRDLKFTQTLGQRIFGVGTVTVSSSDKTTPVLEIQNVKDAFDVKELIHENVEKMKLERKMRVGEILEDGQDFAEDIEDLD
ncbi:MAG: PH domain-containing protein [Bacilli bacterium]|nr:PH domain-containing protein [Bacilli bacterium]